MNCIAHLTNHQLDAAAPFFCAKPCSPSHSSPPPNRTGVAVQRLLQGLATGRSYLFWYVLTSSVTHCTWGLVI